MPSVAQGFKESVSSFNGEFTAVAHSTEEGVVICSKHKFLRWSIHRKARLTPRNLCAFLSVAVGLRSLSFVILGTEYKKDLDWKKGISSFHWPFSSLPLLILSTEQNEHCFHLLGVSFPWEQWSAQQEGECTPCRAPVQTLPATYVLSDCALKACPGFMLPAYMTNLLGCILAQYLS